MVALSAADIIRKLNLLPHPEGGYYAETFRDPDNGTATGRAASTAIYYLLDKGQTSHWHRVDAAEVWHFYTGSSLELSISENGKPRQTLMLGADLAAGELPQICVPAGCWQSATTVTGWALVGCTVAPGFQFEGFEMAPSDWQPD